MTVSEFYSVDQKVELTQSAHCYNDRLKIGAYNYIKDPALKLELIPTVGMAGNESIKDRIRQNLRNSDQLAKMRATQMVSQERVSQAKNYSKEMMKFQSKKTLERIKNRLTNLVFVEPKQEPGRDAGVMKLVDPSQQSETKAQLDTKVYFRQTKSSTLLKTFNRTTKSQGGVWTAGRDRSPLTSGDSFYKTQGSFGIGFIRPEVPDTVIRTSSDLRSPPLSPHKLARSSPKGSIVNQDIKGEMARVSGTFQIVKLIEDIGSLREENKLFSQELLNAEMEAERQQKRAKSKVLRRERIKGCYDALQPTQRARELLIESGALQQM